MTKFVKKPVVIDAMQFVGPGLDRLQEQFNFDNWIVANQGDRKCRYVGSTLHIDTLEGVMVAHPGDWIIRGVKGEIYPCKPDIFDATYSPAVTPQDDKAV